MRLVQDAIASANGVRTSSQVLYSGLQAMGLGGSSTSL